MNKLPKLKKRKVLERRYLLPIIIGFIVILEFKGLTNIFSSCFIGGAVGEVDQKMWNKVWIFVSFLWGGGEWVEAEGMGLFFLGAGGD